MSFKVLQITTQQGHNLQLDVFRKVHHFAIRKKFLRTFTGQSETTVVVQYGLGIVGKGTNLKAALNDFYTNWNYFCAESVRQEQPCRWHTRSNGQPLDTEE